MRAANDNITSALPYGVAPMGLSRTAAAAYIGVSPSMFDVMVKDGRMPSPKQINARTVWHRIKLEIAFDGLPEREEANPWDEDEESQIGQVSNAGRKRRN